MIEYYLGNLGLSESSEQAKFLRKIVLANRTDTDIIDEFTKFILSQVELYSDTVKIINKSLMAGYGSEYYGLGKDNFGLKASIYKKFMEKFPNEFSFNFQYADCCLINNGSVGEIYPILKDGMLADKENIYYPTADLFYLIHESPFSFEFDMLLLDKYYQPCDKESFDEYVNEFKEKYNGEMEQDCLKKLKWKGE